MTSTHLRGSARTLNKKADEQEKNRELRAAHIMQENPKRKVTQNACSEFPLVVRVQQGAVRLQRARQSKAVLGFQEQRLRDGKHTGAH